METSRRTLPIAIARVGKSRRPGGPLPPCYDLWEEHPEYLHPYTLAAIYALLQAAGELLPDNQPRFADAAEEIRAFVLRHGVPGYYDE